MRSHEARPSSVPPKLEFEGTVNSQHSCPQSKLWRGQSLPIPPWFTPLCARCCQSKIMLRVT